MMAAGNLKPPSYFSRPVVTSRGKNDAPELIPPSLFQKSKQKIHNNVPKQEKDVCHDTPPSRQTKDAAVQPCIQQEFEDPSTIGRPQASPQIPHHHLKELSEATMAIIELNKENAKLLKRSKVEEDEGTHNLQKERYRTSAEPRPPIYLEPRPVDYHHPHVFPIEHTSQVITKQASEIGQLKAEMQNLTAHYQLQIQELKGRVRDQEVDNVTAARQLDARLKQSEESHTTEIGHMKALSQQKQNQLEETIKTQSVEIQKSNAALKETHHLKLQLERQFESTELQLKNQLRECEEETSQLEEQVKRLQAYMNNSLTSNKTTATWQVEKQRYNQQIKNLEKECSSLKTSLELTNLRLTSATEIQAIQDIELSKESSDNFTKTENILTKWRESVFKLMVQMKSHDLTVKMTEQNHTNIVGDLQAKVESLTNEMGILNHRLSDSHAQLQIQLNRNQVLEEEVMSSQEVAVILDQRLEESVQACQQIKTTVKQHVCSVNVIEESMQSALRNLSRYDHRISYAVGRIEMLKGLFQRKDAMWKLKVDGICAANRDVVELPSANCEIDLKEELKQTMEERDMLATRLKEDAQVALQQIQASAIANESEINEKADKIQELEILLAEKSKNVEISIELECQLNEASKNIEKLEQELTKERRKNKKVSDERQQTLDAEYCSQLAVMEGHVNTARREHTKAVVSMRQCERQAVREKQRLEDLNKSQESFYKKDIEKLQKQVNNLQKDNNILKATLRQEGLIEKCVISDERQEGQGDVHVTESEQPQLDTDQYINGASLSNLVDDVKNLTSHVLTSD